MISPCYKTELGKIFYLDSLKGISQLKDESVNLVITSPPFALQRQKEYGNKDQNEYVDWLSDFAYKIKPKLASDGSFVLDLGGAYQQGIPARSLYNFKLLINLCDKLGYILAQDFYWHNPSKLPSPIEWVNKRKIRVKDSVNTIWWLSKSPFPKSNIKNVLVEYSENMKRLLKNPKKYYTPKLRPSGHDIGNNFAKDNGGAIPSNLLQIPNSESNSKYLNLCKFVNTKGHPARFPEKLPEFFIKMLTEEGDLVVDIFAGSNTTGYVAEKNKRHWISFENNIEYIASSIFRFTSNLPNEENRNLYKEILEGKSLDISSKISIDMKCDNPMSQKTLLEYL